MSTDTQPVVKEADTTVQPSSEAEGARKEADLDTLLAQYDQETQRTADTTQTTQTTAQTQSDPALLERLQAVEGIAKDFAAQKFKREIDETVNDIRGDIPTDIVENDIVEAWLDAQARKDPRLQQAWLQKEANPKQWGRIKSELGREFKKKFDKMPDRQVTEDRDAVTAAVRGTSTRVPQEPAAKLGRMSNSELRDHVRKEYGFDPGF